MPKLVKDLGVKVLPEDEKETDAICAELGFRLDYVESAVTVAS